MQQLVIDHGGYDKITPEAWANFDHEMALWKEWIRGGGAHEQDDRYPQQRKRR